MNDTQDPTDGETGHYIGPTPGEYKQGVNWNKQSIADRTCFGMCWVCRALRNA